MTDLFSFSHKTAQDYAPLAVRMRPRYLHEFFGQDKAVGPGSWLKKAIEHDVLSSVILYGPAGTGKTTLARIIAHTTQAEFCEVSAVGGTVKDLRQQIDGARSRLLSEGRKTILFVDEIHRFTKSQQDALLHAVEDRIVVLIGATTENPYFEVNSALLSRSRVVELEALSDEAIDSIITQALKDKRGLKGRFILADDARSLLIRMSGGDARSALTTLELASQMAMPLDADSKEVQPAKQCKEEAEGKEDHDAQSHGEPLIITQQDVIEANPRPGATYDKNGDMHYDIISAFIKSMRGSDPDAAIYWLARMLDAGEDPKFIARRIFILASEDIGNADPQALLIAEAAFKATEVIGMPECRINLAQAAVYMALAPKSNASYLAINKALAEVRKGPKHLVPAHLRDRHRPGSDGYGVYLYPHDYSGGWVSQQYLPEGIAKRTFYTPGPRGWEAWRQEGFSRDRLDEQEH